MTRALQGDLAGKVAIVTGSTQGVGEAIARRFMAWGGVGVVVTDRDRVARTLGVDDHGLVAGEAFRQWVIEDRFAGGRPPWELAGAELAADVRPYDPLGATDMRAIKGLGLFLVQFSATGRRSTPERVGNHPRCCINYDASRFIKQGLDYLAFVEILHDRIKMFHVKDAEFNPTGRQGMFGGYQPWLKRAARDRSLGDGQVDFKAIFSKLAEYDYAGWAVYEWEDCLTAPAEAARRSSPSASSRSPTSCSTTSPTPAPTARPPAECLASDNHAQADRNRCQPDSKLHRSEFSEAAISSPGKVSVTYITR